MTPFSYVMNLFLFMCITTVCSFISILYTICNISFRFDASDIRNYLIKAWK
jgi:hypothetical protein